MRNDLMDEDKNKPYLIVVDDEPNFSESLQMALEDIFEVRRAHSIKTALLLLKDRIPDVALLDLKLPDGSGTDLIQRLRGLNPMPIVVVMTAYAMSGNVRNVFKEGAIGYLTKPLDIDKLKRALKLRLENRYYLMGCDNMMQGGR
jgi:ActR/RegA family two-component response regulator